MSYRVTIIHLEEKKSKEENIASIINVKATLIRLLILIHLKILWLMKPNMHNLNWKNDLNLNLARKILPGSLILTSLKFIHGFLILFRMIIALVTTDSTRFNHKTSFTYEDWKKKKKNLRIIIKVKKIYWLWQDR